MATSEVSSPSDVEQQNADGGGQELEAGTSSGKRPLRALDVGCSVGGITFELTRAFDEVREGYNICTRRNIFRDEVVWTTAPSRTRKQKCGEVCLVRAADWVGCSGFVVVVVDFDSKMCCTRMWTISEGSVGCFSPPPPLLLLVFAVGAWSTSESKHEWGSFYSPALPLVR